MALIFFLNLGWVWVGGRHGKSGRPDFREKKSVITFVPKVHDSTCYVAIIVMSVPGLVARVLPIIYITDVPPVNDTKTAV